MSDSEESYEEYEYHKHSKRKSPFSHEYAETSKKIKVEVTPIEEYAVPQKTPETGQIQALKGKCVGAKGVRKKKTTTEQKSNIKQEIDEGNSTNFLQLKNPAPSEIYTNVGKVEYEADWQIEDVVAERVGSQVRFVRNVIRLLDDEGTIPFIARYRREQTGNMEPETLLLVKEAYEKCMSVKQRMASIETSITKLNKMTPAVLRCLRSAQTISELEHIYAPFKTSSTRSLAEKARSLGLEDAAMASFEGTKLVDPAGLVTDKTESLSKVMEGLRHIIADVISKKKEVLDLIRRHCGKDSRYLMLIAKKIPQKEDKPKKEVAKGKKPAEEKKKQQAIEKDTFATYYDFSCAVDRVAPHQVLAIFRGESLKILTVKVDVHETFENMLRNLCQLLWFSRGQQSDFRQRLLRDGLADAFKRLLVPLIGRHVRGELAEEAQRASLTVFARNLKQLLLTPPVRGQPLLAIDPGFMHGCKVAVIDANGCLLRTSMVFLNSRGVNMRAEMEKIRCLLFETGCSLIALGNGSGCRETEQCLSGYIRDGFFRPLDVQYTIVSEQGVSIFSCSPLAKKELPDLEPNLISAVSLARRLQDPLSELVKVEPRHLGVGMYQHDVPEKRLTATLGEVVVECVSFVGVDVNAASESLLRHVAGLNAARAGNIVAWRTANGRFTNRDQLHLVKGVGAKTFQQCAGFLRVLPETSGGEKGLGEAAVAKKQPKAPKKMVKKAATVSTPNPLDQTWIHPESYLHVFRLLEECGASLDDFGQDHFKVHIRSFVQQKGGVGGVAQALEIGEEQSRLIVTALEQTSDNDLRTQCQQPLFRRSLLVFSDLKCGDNVTGRVQNVTTFGAFVDIGVGRSGLIHVSKMNKTTLSVGDRVEVEVLTVCSKSLKIGLKLLKVL